MKSGMAATTALASSLVLLAAIGLPAKAAPSFDLKSAAAAATGMVELVGHGGGGHGGGMGGHMGGGHSMSALGNGAHIGGGHSGGGHHMSALGNGAHVGGGHSGHAHAGMPHGIDGGHHGHHGPSVAWNHGSWDHHGHGHGHDHFKHRHNFFAGDIFIYGGGYGYNDCGWLRRQAIVTGSPYWWRRYQDCLYYD